ncbi:MAG: glycosyltransferase family 9 protein [Victivallales bacterium]|nr:glycosyltransferase family 9 protein [Victivallales bacterium]
MRVLIVKPSSFGDVLHTFPAVALIRSAVPDVTRITWIVNDSFVDVVRLCPGIDRIVPFPRRDIRKLSVIRSFLHDLRQEDYDLAIDYQGLLRSGLMVKASRAKEKVGFAHAREGSPFFYTRKLSLDNLLSHAVEKNLELTRFALNIPKEIPVPAPRFQLDEKGREEAELLIPSNGNPLLGVCFSSRWESKNWSVSFIAETLDLVAKEIPGLEIFLLGAENDWPAGEEIRNRTHVEKLQNLAGKTSFHALAAMLSRSTAMFTVDSGPMHLAAALGIPCIAMFGSTNPTLTGPYGPAGFHTILTTTCFQTPCMERECPLHKNCSEGFSTQIAATAIIDKIRRNHP